MKTRVFLLALLSLPAIVQAEDSLKRVAAELANGIAASGKKQVAVLSLPQHDNRPSEGPEVVAEKLASYLATDKRFQVIERSQIQQMLKELHLSQSGAMGSQGVKHVGEMLGAEVVVTGTLIDLNDGTTEINARGVQANNGRVLAASRAQLERTWAARPRLSW